MPLLRNSLTVIFWAPPPFTRVFILFNANFSHHDFRDVLYLNDAVLVTGVVCAELFLPSLNVIKRCLSYRHSRLIWNFLLALIKTCWSLFALVHHCSPGYTIQYVCVCNCSVLCDSYMWVFYTYIVPMYRGCLLFHEQGLCQHEGLMDIVGATPSCNDLLLN